MDAFSSTPPAVVIAAARSEVVLYSNEILSRKLVTELAAARKERGVKVVVLLPAANFYARGAYHLWLAGQGVLLYRVGGTPFSADFAVIDRTYLLTGNRIGNPGSLEDGPTMLVKNSPATARLYDAAVRFTYRVKAVTLAQSLSELPR